MNKSQLSTCDSSEARFWILLIQQSREHFVSANCFGMLFLFLHFLHWNDKFSCSCLVEMSLLRMLSWTENVRVIMSFKQWSKFNISRGEIRWSQFDFHLRYSRMCVEQLPCPQVNVGQLPFPQVNNVTWITFSQLFHQGRVSNCVKSFRIFSDFVLSDALWMKYVLLFQDLASSFQFPVQAQTCSVWVVLCVCVCVFVLFYILYFCQFRFLFLSLAVFASCRKRCRNSQPPLPRSKSLDVGNAPHKSIISSHVFFHYFCQFDHLMLRSGVSFVPSILVYCGSAEYFMVLFWNNCQELPLYLFIKVFSSSFLITEQHKTIAMENSLFIMSYTIWGSFYFWVIAL